MRYFDKLNKATKEEILTAAISYAKADVAEFESNDALIEYAVGFGEMWLLTLSDFKGINTDKISAFKGERPVWRKKRW
jgi:hypothetical protein